MLPHGDRECRPLRPDQIPSCFLCTARPHQLRGLCTSSCVAVQSDESFHICRTSVSPVTDLRGDHRAVGDVDRVVVLAILLRVLPNRATGVVAQQRYLCAGRSHGD